MSEVIMVSCRELVKILIFILHNGKNPAGADCADKLLSILNIHVNIIL